MVASRGDHHVAERIDPMKPLDIDLQQSVPGGGQLDLSFLRFGPLHAIVHRRCAEDFSPFVFVEHSRRFFPDVEVFLAHGQQDGNVLLRHHMSLAEPCVFRDAYDDLRQIMAEHMSYCLRGRYFFHFISLADVAGWRESIARLPLYF